ncbi:hypothetical protein OHA98_07430 [Streptomyces sp. NBC_00654]|uniref:hypothetical protein n=1 Tax=Streptomyces sp. NBC_00654 TaxID=2975799 RepID=UPI00224EDA42|nr:hypothetical protein [Streptomyces sp. NBC_00654]MCX4964657.1 hypothetical protein [Streptomyces sp. NBC_00654]
MGRPIEGHGVRASTAATGSVTSATSVTALSDVSEPPWSLSSGTNPPDGEQPAPRAPTSGSPLSKAPAAKESGAAEGPGPAPRRPSPRRPADVRRGPADPVKPLMRRHRDLRERAVDALEIAALGLLIHAAAALSRASAHTRV